MWQYALGDEAAMEVGILRRWLGPRDASLQKLLRDDESAPSRREEFTCEWFQSHLLTFSRSKHDTLAIHGPAGCGKSVLSGWIVERLQRPMGKKAYVTISGTLGMSFYQGRQINPQSFPPNRLEFFYFTFRNTDS